MFRRRSGAELSVLLCGFGARGRQWRTEIDRHRRLRLAGVIDPDPAARAAAGGNIGAWGSLEEGLEAVAVDGVVVATPPGEHVRDAERSLGAGCGVLIEKPLALSVEHARAIVDAAAATRRPALAVQNFRHRRWARTVAEVLSSGEIGEPTQTVVVSARPSGTAPPSLASLPHAPLWDAAIHDLDLLRVRRDEAPAEVEAAFVPDADGGTYRLEISWDDGFRALYRHREGPPFFHHYEWIEGDRGALSVENERVTMISREHRPRRMRAARGPTPEAVLLGAFADGLAGDPVPEAMTAGDNVATVATVDAAIRSLTQGTPVRVTLDKTGKEAGR